MPPNDSSSQPSVIDLVTLVALIAAWLYIAGWTYALHYFGRFEVGLLALEIPYEYYFMYGYLVVKDWWWAVIASVLLIGLCLVWDSKRRLIQHGLHLLLLLLVCVAFLGASGLGRQTATQHYETWSQEDFPRHPRVRVWLKPNEDDSTVMLETAQTFPQGCYRLLLQNKNTLFLFRPRAGISQLQLAAVAIPITETRAIRIVPQYDSCP